jgi:outer membrane protein TolC
MKTPAAAATVVALAMLALGGCASPYPGSPFDDASGLRYVPGPTGRLRSAQADAPPTLGPEPDLAEYVAYAMANNAGLEAAFNRWRAALERVPQVTALPDPRLSYRYYIRQVETRVGPMRHGIGLSQTFPWLGKLELAGDAATKAAEAERLRFEAARLELVRDVTAAYAEYYHLARRVAVLEDHMKLVRLAEQTVRSRYRTSTAPHADVVRAQMELARLEERLVSLGDMRGPVIARLNAALNRPAGADLPWPTALPGVAAGFTDDQALRWLADSSPTLKALDAEVAARKHRVELARKAAMPDITLGVDYTQIGRGTGAMRPADDGQDAIAVMLSVNLPIWRDKIEAGVREARHRQWAAESARRQKLNDLSQHLKMALYRFRDAQRKAALYRDALLPKGREAVGAAQAALRSGNASLTDLVDAQRVLLEFELSAERARADRVAHVSEIEMLIGVPLDSLAPSSSSPLEAPLTESERTEP